MMEVMVTDPPKGVKYEENFTSLAQFLGARRLTNYIPPGGQYRL